jgi:hypothetical protein
MMLHSMAALNAENCLRQVIAPIKIQNSTTFSSLVQHPFTKKKNRRL